MTIQKTYNFIYGTPAQNAESHLKRRNASKSVEIQKYNE